MLKFGLRASALLICTLIAVGCAGQAATAPSAVSGKAAATRPVADHHIHLLSPLAAKWKTPPPLPVVTLPDEFASIVRARNELRGNQKALEELYTPDALYYRGGAVGWARGNKAAAGRVVWTISDYPYRIVPVAFNRTATSAQIAGYFLEGTDFSDANRNGSPAQLPTPANDLKHRFGTSLLSLSKSVEGRWQISAETYVFEQPELPKAVTAAEKIKEMDAAGTRLAAVISNAYYFDSVQPEIVSDVLSKIRNDNDWTAAQAAQYPARLAAFCSVNPTKDYALSELNRCASSRKFRGLKLHFNAAQANLRDPSEVAKIRLVMAKANEHRLPMIIHVRPGNDYGAEQATTFLRQLVAAAPDVPIQIAHLWGGETYSASALQIFANAVSSGDPVTKNLYFDISGLGYFKGRPEVASEIVSRIRQIGVARILWGSDAPIEESWQKLRDNLPLNDDEFRAIAGNVAPYLRHSTPKQ